MSISLPDELSFVGASSDEVLRLMKQMLTDNDFSNANSEEIQQTEQVLRVALAALHFPSIKNLRSGSNAELTAFAVKLAELRASTAGEVLRRNFPAFDGQLSMLVDIHGAAAYPQAPGSKERLLADPLCTAIKHAVGAGVTTLPQLRDKLSEQFSAAELESLRWWVVQMRESRILDWEYDGRDFTLLKLRSCSL